jgi:hypothetical protein
MNHEQQAAAAFDKQSVIFDQLYSADTIIQYKRQRVRNHVERYLSPNSNILELNAGTGEGRGLFCRQRTSCTCYRYFKRHAKSTERESRCFKFTS